VRNALLPTLDAFAYYGGSGAGGAINPLVPACSADIEQVLLHPEHSPAAVPNRDYGGLWHYPESTRQLHRPRQRRGVDTKHPVAQSRSASQTRCAQSEYRQAQVSCTSWRIQVRIEVRNAQFDVKQNRASVQAAQYAGDFARQTLDADQQKLKVGLTTTNRDLAGCLRLTTSESNLVSAKPAYEKRAWNSIVPPACC